MGTMNKNPISSLFTSHFVKVAGVDLHYIDEGKGETVVMIHGNPTWCYFYRNLIHALKDKYRVIAIDLLGCGLSGRPTNMNYRLRRRIEHIEEFMRALDITDCSLVMHDWGGPIGSGYAVRHPERIRRLVYLNTTLTEVDTLPWLIRTSARLPLGRMLTKFTGNFIRLATGVGVHRRLPREIKQGYLFPYKSSSSREAIAAFVEDIPLSADHPSYQDLVEVGDGLKKFANIPVKIVWGLRDPCFHREMLTKVAGHFPHAEIVEIPDASHLVLEDSPERCCAVIREFFDRTAIKGEVTTGSLNGGEALTATDRSTSSATGVSQSELPAPAWSLYGQLTKWAQANPNRPALIAASPGREAIKSTSTSYRDLLEASRRYERGLTDLGLTLGDRVLFLVPFGLELLALAFAVMGRGAIPVFVDPGVGIANLSKCIESTDCAAAIIAPKAKVLQLLCRSSFAKMKFVVTATDWRLSRGATLSFLKKYSCSPLEGVVPNNVCLIACTSGATGVPKGVEFTQEMIERHVALFGAALGQREGERDMPLLPLFALYDIALGATVVLPTFDASRPLELDAAHVAAVVRELQVTSSFGSPTLWNKISEYAIRSGITFTSLKRVFLIGAPVADATLARVRRVVSAGGSVFTPYGSTEALPVAIVDAPTRLDVPQVVSQDGLRGVQVGHVVPNTMIRVVAIADGPLRSLESLPARQLGEIIVTGDQVSKSYFRNERANRGAKVEIDGVIWHRMGDVGYLDESGSLYFCGRSVHRVMVGERTYYSVPAELVVNAHPMVRRSALVGLYGGREAAIVIEPEVAAFPTSAAAEQRFIKEILALTEKEPATLGISKFFFHKSFPVDGRHNAKIFRGQLGEWATRFEKKRLDSLGNSRVVNWSKG